MKQDLRARVEAYLADKLAFEHFSITSFEQIAGAGLSRSVIRVTASIDGDRSNSYVLLLASAASPVPPNRVAEYSALRALSNDPELKVPHAHCMEDTAEALGCPVIVTSLLPGVSSPRQLLKPKYSVHGERIAREGFEILGRLAVIDAAPIDLGPSIAMPDPADVHELALAGLESVLNENRATNRPITAAALRHLRRTVPRPPEKISIVHGDYRIGNYLFDETGITGVIDWEMVHKGSPLEDLAWSLLPNWEFGSLPGLISGHLTRKEAIAIWESTSGLTVDEDALDWWILFCHLKAIGIWTTGPHMFSAGKTSDLLVSLVGYAAAKQEAYIAQFLKGKRA